MMALGGKQKNEIEIVCSLEHGSQFGRLAVKRFQQKICPPLFRNLLLFFGDTFDKKKTAFCQGRLRRNHIKIIYTVQAKTT